tara:strand:+ start:71 stop:1000 length:930 start_codon:yes stop_codon:yes gene_type:complete
MTHLYWKDANGTKNLISKPFKGEINFEDEIFKRQELLGDDIFLMNRQVRGGGQRGRPDIIGIDKDKNVCVVELKNETVSPDIISQVVKYAVWAEQSPDAIKNLWFESSQPEEYEINFDEKYQVRIIIVAPSIEEETAIMMKRIDWEVDLIEINRWHEGENEFFFVKNVKAPDRKRPSIVRGQPVYNEEFYMERRNKKSVPEFMKLSKKLEKISKIKKWGLVLKYNKNYCAMQYGNNNVFGVDWVTSKTFVLFLRLHLADRPRKSLPKKFTTSTRSGEKTWRINLENGYDLNKIMTLLEKAFENIKEKRG